MIRGYLHTLGNFLVGESIDPTKRKGLSLISRQTGDLAPEGFREISIVDELCTPH